jgi:hypothetical protein
MLNLFQHLKKDPETFRSIAEQGDENQLALIIFPEPEILEVIEGQPK